MAESHQEQDALNEQVKALQTLKTQHRRVKLTLKRTEERLRQLLENANDICFTVSSLGILLSVSPNIKEQLGHACRDIKGKPLADLLHPDDVPVVRAFINLAHTSGTPQKGFEYRIRHADGSYHWHISNGYAVNNASGEMAFYVGMSQDITKRRKLAQALKDSENRLELASEAAGYALWEYYFDKDAIYCSIKMYEDLGYTSEELPSTIEQTWAFVHPDDLEATKKNFDNHCSRQTPAYNAEYRLRSKEGLYVWHRSTGKVIEWGEEGFPRRMLGLTRNIARRKNNETELRKSALRLHTILEASPVGVTVFRRDGTILFSNSCFAQMANMAPEMLVNMNIKTFYADSAMHKQLLRVYDEQGTVSNEEAELKLSGNQTYWSLITWTPMVYEGEDAILCWTYDFTELKEAQEKLRQLATTDGLTGLYNRRYFLELSTRELDRSRRYGFPLAVLMIDADHFKNVNDTYGHDVGDEVLRLVASTGNEKLRDVDIYGRLGGEEFAILLPDTDTEGALATGERLREAFAALSLDTPKGELTFTVSIGVCTFAEKLTTVEDMLKQADQALYEAKESGRNRVVLAKTP